MKIDGLALELSRLASGISREELAEVLGVSPRTVANWENDGIPEHREALVRSRLGGTFSASLEEAERMRYFETPKGKKERERMDEEMLQVFEDSKYGGMREALKNASIEDLLDEVRERFIDLSKRFPQN